MALNNVKEITISYPYRQLEYIHFNGAERIDTPFYAGTAGVNYQTEFSIDELPSSESPLYIGVYDSTLNTNLARLYLPQVNSTGIHINIGNTWSSYASSTPIGTKLKFSASLSKTSDGNPRVYFYLYDQVTGNSILSTNPLQASAVGDLNITQLMSIGCGIYITSSTTSYVNYWKGNCYNFQQRSGGASGPILYDMIPCQRKSDNVCGLYDTINSVFYPMTGTTITTGAAGPIVNENPDWVKVKKIEDSNGNIIWGSQSAFPYRRLEYVDMYGKYYNSGNRPAVGYYFLDVKFNTSNPINPNDSYGIPFGCAGSNNRRLFFAETSTGLYHRVKNVSDTLVANLSALNANTKYELRIRTYFTNNTAGRWWFALQNLDNDTQVYGLYYNNTTYSMNLSELPYIHINAHAYNSSGTSATPTNVIHKGANNFKVYRYFVREDDGSSNIKWDYYPVQRKSDGAVGFYNVKTGAFSVIRNASNDSTVTTITEPIADEYWDLTAPA